MKKQKVFIPIDVDNESINEGFENTMSTKDYIKLLNIK